MIHRVIVPSGDRVIGRSESNRGGERTICKQTKLLLLVGTICFGSALIWQNYSRVIYELSHPSASTTSSKSGSAEGWDLNRMYIHHPPMSNVLLLVGTFALMLGVVSIGGDVRRWRRGRRGVNASPNAV